MGAIRCAVLIIAGGGCGDFSAMTRRFTAYLAVQPLWPAGIDWRWCMTAPLGQITNMLP